MKKIVLAIIMIFTIASIGLVCADNSTDVIKDGHMFIRNSGEFNPDDVNSNETVVTNPESQYSPINNYGKSLKTDLNKAQVNVSGLKEDGESYGQVWSKVVSSTGDKNLNKYFTMSEKFENYTNDLGTQGIGYNENVSNTILKTWYPDIWENVTNLHINTTKNGYHFFAYVIKQQNDGIHVDGVLISSFVFKVIEIKNAVNGENPNATTEDILNEIGDDISNYVNNTTNDDSTVDVVNNSTEKPDILNSVIENNTAVDEDSVENDTVKNNIINNTTEENTTDNDTSDDAGFTPLNDTNDTTIPVTDDGFDPIVDENSNVYSNENSDNDGANVVTGSNVTGNPILLIVIVIGLLVGAYVKR